MKTQPYVDANRRRFGRWTSAVAVVMASLGLGACAGGASAEPRASETPGQASSVHRRPVAPAESCTTPCLYLTNGTFTSPGSVTTYSVSADGNVARSRAIQGPKTGLGLAWGIALDALGNVYVANHTANAVQVYAPEAHGNVAPAKVISGSRTWLDGPSGIALDGSDNIYVANAGHGERSRGSVLVFAAGAHGNVAPIRVIGGSNTRLDFPSALAFGPMGNLFVADKAGRAIHVYAPTSNGNVAPIRTISGERTLIYGPSAIAFASNGALYVANYAVSPAGSITVYAPGDGGNAAPIRSIYGPNTGLDFPTGIALDSNDSVYVANEGSEGGRGKVTVYTAGASGDVTPIQSIFGSKTGLNHPSGIAVR
jgi:hypothetical protein